MDGEYGGTQPCHDDSHYKNAMFVLTTVMSDASTHPGWLVVDAGDKAVHPGSVGVTVLPPGFNPAVDGMTSSEEGGLTYRRGGDEHGIVEGPAHIIAKLPIGSQLWLLPGHCDPTINFYDEFSVCRVVQSSSSDGDGTPVLVMESKIGIEGRGPGI
jgi:D-threonine aldolase